MRAPRAASGRAVYRLERLGEGEAFEAERKRQLRNERQRRWYARQHPHCREQVCPVSVGDELVAMLVSLHWLAETEAEDRKQIGQAISELLKDAARNQHRNF